MSDTDLTDPQVVPAPVVRIVHRDDDLVVVSKPGGMMVHRARGARPGEWFALQAVAHQLGGFLYPVHRLDRATSGLLCFALSSEMAAALHAALRSEATIKEYLVLVRGETPETFVSDRPLTSERGEKQPARSEFRRLAVFSRCSLLAARITTGRRHQIRRHLAHLAHQVIGDSSHGKGRINRFFRETYGLPRMFLHARRLVVAHPRTGDRLDLADPLPEDLRAFLERLPDVEPAVVAGL
ncbi:MAG: RluA family pseudouridine synthase [Planctomycetota bacterium]|jgi:tRNA pseudouridine65 synthase